MITDKRISSEGIPAAPLSPRKRKLAEVINRIEARLAEKDNPSPPQESSDLTKAGLAGAYSGIPNIAGLPVDAAAAALNHFFGMDIKDPIGGTRSLKKGAAMLDPANWFEGGREGANPFYEPQGPAERTAAFFGEGLTGGLGMTSALAGKAGTKIATELSRSLGRPGATAPITPGASSSSAAELANHRAAELIRQAENQGKLYALEGAGNFNAAAMSGAVDNLIEDGSPGAKTVKPILMTAAAIVGGMAAPGTLKLTEKAKNKYLYTRGAARQDLAKKLRAYIKDTMPPEDARFGDNYPAELSRRAEKESPLSQLKGVTQTVGEKTRSQALLGLEDAMSGSPQGGQFNVRRLNIREQAERLIRKTMDLYSGNTEGASEMAESVLKRNPKADPEDFRRFAFKKLEEETEELVDMAMLQNYIDYSPLKGAEYLLSGAKDPGTLALVLRDLAKEDPSGRAMRGLKEAVFTVMMNKMGVRNIDPVTNKPNIDGEWLTKMLSGDHRDALKVVYGKDGLALLDGLDSAMKQWRFKPSQQADLPTPSNSMLSNLARIAGARIASSAGQLLNVVGGRASEAGIGLQIAQRGSAIAKNIADNLTVGPFYEMMGDALLNPSEFSRLMALPEFTDMKTLRKINSYIYPQISSQEFDKWFFDEQSGDK